MRVIICGSRGATGISHMNYLKEAIKLSGFKISHVIHGANEDSVDRLARMWAQKEGIPVTPFPMESREELEAQGIPYVAAGPRRNKRMIDVGRPEGCIALWDGTSPGTKNMMDLAKKAGVVGFLYRLNGGSHERWPKQLALF